MAPTRNTSTSGSSSGASSAIGLKAAGGRSTVDSSSVMRAASTATCDFSSTTLTTAFPFRACR